MEPRWIISDLHIGLGMSDEFAADAELKAFLLTIPDRSLIINGDLFELLKDDRLDDIVKARQELIDLLFQKALVYVTGNHDRSMLNSSFAPPQFMGVPVAKYFIESGILYTHGDVFDPANNDSNHVVGDTVTGMVGWLAENVSPEVNGWSRGLEKFTRDVGRNGDPVHYRNMALDFVEHLLIDWHRIDRVVLGHTHQVDYEKRNSRWEYFNTGCWINRNFDVLKLDN